MTFGRRARRWLLVLPLLGVAALAAVPTLGAEIGVSIVDKTFQPAQLTIAAGDTVTWTVTKSIAEIHSVTSGKVGDADAGSHFDSGLDGLKDDGQTFEWTFTEPGTFDYYCTVHSTEMTGQIVVTAAVGGEGGEGIPFENRVLAGGILVATIIAGFGAASLWRRMNPA